MGGLDLILDLLRRMDYVTRNSDTHTLLIGCVKALMNSAVSDVTTCPFTLTNLYKYIRFMCLFLARS